MPKRTELLRKIETTLNERGVAYGGKENLDRIASYWGLYLNRKLTARDVAILMALLKVSRLHHDSKAEDSLLDLIGYAILAASNGE